MGFTHMQFNLCSQGACERQGGSLPMDAPFHIQSLTTQSSHRAQGWSPGDQGTRCTSAPRTPSLGKRGHDHQEHK